MSTPIDGEDKQHKSLSEKHDLGSLLIYYIKKINWKIGILLFMIGIIIFSDIFAQNVLVYFSNTMDINSPNNKGTSIQLSFLIVGYWILDSLTQASIL